MRVAVIGGGLAGLSAACELADRGHAVSVFEKRPWCGGKTYSHRDRETGEPVDNGQHVFMACTTAYTGFLERLGTLGLARRQRRLRVAVYDAKGRRADIIAANAPPPRHLARSFATYRHLGVLDRVRVARAMLRAARMDADEAAALTEVPFAQWLRQAGQRETAIREFWDFLLIPTLNCRSEAASAAAALFVLREGFLASPGAAALGVPAVGLSQLHVEPAERYIRERGGEIHTGAEILGVEVEGGAFTLRQRAGDRQRFDGCVLAVPHTKLAALLPEGEWATRLCADLAAIPTAPIVNLHCWFDRPVAPFAFAAFVGSELQWVFNRDRLDAEPRPGRHHLVISLSAAEPYMALDRAELRERFLPQLRAALPAAREATLVDFAAIKEPEATFVPAPGIRRPPAATPFSNLVLAGAFTDTGWPATMESAVRSGLQAARTLDVQSQTYAVRP